MAERNSADEQNELLRYWIWLNIVFGAGSIAVHECLDHFHDDPQALYEALVAGDVPNMPVQLQKDVKRHSLAEADNLLYYCRQHDIALLTMDSEAYPDCLRNIFSPPILLTAQGNLSLLGAPLSLSVVGTRNPSPYSVRVTEAVLSEICKCGFVVVSGFAKGIDAVSHKTALDYGAGTIAVLGCGVNVNYPREHVELRERMLSSGKGLFLSEYMPGVQPYPGNFPRRNRILSGLSYATAVMEAASRSGSLITADCALEQGRFLFCVPPADLFDRRYGGVIPLLRDGAIPLMSHQDVLIAYYMQYPQFLSMDQDGVKPSESLCCSEEDAKASEQTETAEKAKKDKQPAAVQPQPAPENQSEPAVPETVPKREPETELGKRIVDYLRTHGDTVADDIADALDEDLSDVLYELTALELDNFVHTLLGKEYRAVETMMA